MKKLLILLLLFLSVTTFSVAQVQAISHGEVVQGRQTFSYNVQFQNKLSAMVFDAEWGLTETLGAGARYIYAGEQVVAGQANSKQKNYLDIFLKFKVIDLQGFDVAGRIGLMKNFQKLSSNPDEITLHKTLGVVVSKAQNSFLTTHAGLDYSFDTRGVGLFVGADYRLTKHTYFQLGWEKYMSGRDVQGLMLGFRTDL